MAITVVVCVIVWVMVVNVHHECTQDTCRCAQEDMSTRPEPETETISGKQGTERYAPEDVRTHHGP